MAIKQAIRTVKNNGDIVLSNILDSVTGESVEYIKVPDPTGITPTGILYRESITPDFGTEIFQRIIVNNIVSLSWWNIPTGGNISNALQEAIDFASPKGYTIKLSPGNYLVNNVQLRNNTFIQDNKSATLTATGTNSDGFRGVGISNLRLDGLKINASGLTPTFRNIYLESCNGVTVENCEFTAGDYGIRSINCNNIQFNRNTVHNMNQWGLFAEGGENIKYDGNTCFSNGFDGLKLAGSVNAGAGTARTLKNVIVVNNISYGNGSDGLDVAGNFLDGVEISNNIFRDNTFQGIDFKILAEYTGEAKNCVIKNNTIISNLNVGINLQCGNAASSYKDVFVLDNYIYGASSTTPNTYAIATNIAQTAGNKVTIANNIVKNYYYGIRLNNTSNSEIYNNNIDTRNICIWIWNGLVSDVSSSNVIYNNFCKSQTEHCISIGFTGVAIIGVSTSNTVRNNRCFSATSAKKGIYDDPLALSIRFGNVVGAYGGAAALPSLPANKGDLIECTVPVDKTHTHWICYADTALNEQKYYPTGLIAKDWLKLKAGLTVNRPTLVDPGYIYIDTNLIRPVFWSGAAWLDLNPDATDVVKGGVFLATQTEVNTASNLTKAVTPGMLTQSGTTALRPTGSRKIGLIYFDTDLGKPIWWKGGVWVDAAGVTV